MKEKYSKEELSVMLDEGIKILTALKDFAKSLLSAIDVTLTSTEKIRGVISEDKKIEPKENQTLEVYSKEDVRGLLAKKTTLNNGAYKEDVIVKQDGDTLRINIKPNTGLSFIDFNTPNSKIIITLPEEELKDVLIDNGSGGVSVEHVKADVVKVDNGSGGIAINAVKGRTGSFESGSGSVAVADSTFTEQTKLHTGSGGITGSGLTAEGTLTLHTGSGSLSLENVSAGQTRGDSGSGSLKLKNIRLTAASEFKAGSGDVELVLTGDQKEYIVSGSTGSGTQNIEGAGGQKNADAVNVLVSAGSGDISVSYAAPATAQQATE